MVMVLVVVWVVVAMGLEVVISHLCGDTNGDGCGGSQQMNIFIKYSNICYILEALYVKRSVVTVTLVS